MTWPLFYNRNTLDGDLDLSSIKTPEMWILIGRIWIKSLSRRRTDWKLVFIGMKGSCGEPFCSKRLWDRNRFKPSSKIFYWPFQGGTSFVDLLCFFFVLSCVCYVLCASVYMCFVVTCWERADLLALVCGVFCEFVTFPLVSWVRCGTWLYRFLIFAPLLKFFSHLCCFAQAACFLLFSIIFDDRMYTIFEFLQQTHLP